METKQLEADTAPLQLLREEFDQNGFLFLESVLSAHEVERYRAVMEQLDQTVGTTVRGEPRRPGDPLEVRNVLEKAPAMADLIDHPRTLPIMVSLMGYNINVNTSHAFIRPPFPKGTNLREQKAIDWHVDVSGASGPVNGRLPWFYTRVGFFFTSHAEPNSGSLKIVPGSHRLAGQPAGLKDGRDPYGTIELAVKAGDVVLFDNRLWHASAPNYGDHRRMNVYFGYSWRWMRPIDYRSYPDEMLSQYDPIRRQLMGAAYTQMGFVFPQAEDVPLRAWMEEQGLGPVTAVRSPLPVA